MNSTPPPTPTPRFDLIGIVTSDLAASLAFYRRLGLEFPPGAEDQPHVETALPGGLRLAFDTEATVSSFMADWTPPTGAGRIGLAFHCDTAAGVDAVHTALVDAGHKSELAPWDAPWGQRYAVVLDPDGNGVDLFAPLAPGAPGAPGAPAE
ncbi:VOC family protein [Streptomyces formicae]|uniref:Putative quinone binding protein n=1 Tax=Streptomyces formicae TaxID=1616117 RepID=A0A291QIU4_9ACTN|nr:VOC family protein [Streptomyces formicae]ATL31373.1 putative quinone binding protein [Streptomyces formicae]